LALSSSDGCGNPDRAPPDSARSSPCGIRDVGTGDQSMVVRTLYWGLTLTSFPGPDDEAKQGACTTQNANLGMTMLDLTGYFGILGSAFPGRTCESS
jgi:hypothetical protein